MENKENIVINKKKLISVVGTTVSAISTIIFLWVAYYYDVGAVCIGNMAYGLDGGRGDRSGFLRKYGEVTPFQHLILLLLILVLCVSIISTAFFSRSSFKLSRHISSRRGIIIVSCAVCMVFFICWLIYLPHVYDGLLDTKAAVLWYFRNKIIFVFLRDALTAFLSILICRRLFTKAS